MNISPGDLIGPLYILGVFRRRDGKSAYQSWLDQGNTGTEADFVNSLMGADGQSAYQLWLSLGNSGSQQDFLDSLVGPQGPTGADGLDGEPGSDGKSAYQSWLDAGNTGTEQDFLDSLKGPVGPVGGAFIQDNFIATTSIISLKQVSLSVEPADPLRVNMTPFKGIPQESGVDFLVEGQILRWDGLALELLLEEGDHFIVNYLPVS